MRVKMLVTRRMKREHSEARMKNKRSPGRGKGINPPPTATADLREDQSDDVVKPSLHLEQIEAKD
jgi:hypothetical protein